MYLTPKVHFKCAQLQLGVNVQLLALISLLWQNYKEEVIRLLKYHPVFRKSNTILSWCKTHLADVNFIWLLLSPSDLGYTASTTI